MRLPERLKSGRVKNEAGVLIGPVTVTAAE
jgi:hypothetical protein